MTNDELRMTNDELRLTINESIVNRQSSIINRIIRQSIKIILTINVSMIIL